MEKQTVIEWLSEKWSTQGTLYSSDIFQAKEMEKQQIVDAFKRGAINEMNGIEEINSEQYYNETFKSE